MNKADHNFACWTRERNLTFRQLFYRFLYISRDTPTVDMFFSNNALHLNTSLKQYEDSQATGNTQRSVISPDNAKFPYRIFKRHRTEQVPENNALFKTA